MLSYEEKDKRAEAIGLYIVASGATMREAAKRFNISKSTVCKDLSERLPRVDKKLYLAVRKVIFKNSKEKYARGGVSVQRKRKEYAK